MNAVEFEEAVLNLVTENLDQTTLTSLTPLTLYKETALKVDLDALDKLCTLFNCPISELLEQRPN